jgi:hypothetical protein
MHCKKSSHLRVTIILTAAHKATLATIGRDPRLATKTIHMQVFIWPMMMSLHMHEARTLLISGALSIVQQTHLEYLLLIQLLQSWVCNTAFSYIKS